GTVHPDHHQHVRRPAALQGSLRRQADNPFDLGPDDRLELVRAGRVVALRLLASELHQVRGRFHTDVCCEKNLLELREHRLVDVLRLTEERVELGDEAFAARLAQTLSEGLPGLGLDPPLLLLLLAPRPLLLLLARLARRLLSAPRLLLALYPLSFLGLAFSG